MTPQPKEQTRLVVVQRLLGQSRKYALALMDHLDHVRITRRVGDVRVLR
ncbi:MAG: SelB C-terminal domain-containing protein [Dehalococcoidia bacterium]|nr:SelB C-terminal domain-containing protein [Dehalococcoidia bacterium]